MRACKTAAVASSAASFRRRPLPNVAPAGVPGAPVGAGAPAMPTTAPGTDLNVLQRVLQGINAHAATLMALGGGMMTGGLGRGLQAAAAQSNVEDKSHLAAANRDATVRALLAAGVPPTVALAAAGNPAVLRAVTMRGFGQQAQAQPQTPPQHDQAAACRGRGSGGAVGCGPGPIRAGACASRELTGWGGDDAPASDTQEIHDVAILGAPPGEARCRPGRADARGLSHDEWVIRREERRLAEQAGHSSSGDAPAAATIRSRAPPARGRDAGRDK